MSPSDEHAYAEPMSEHGDIYSSQQKYIEGLPSGQEPTDAQNWFEHQKNMANQNEEPKMTAFQSLADLFG